MNYEILLDNLKQKNSHLSRQNKKLSFSLKETDLTLKNKENQ